MEKQTNDFIETVHFRLSKRLIDEIDEIVKLNQDIYQSRATFIRAAVIRELRRQK